MKKRESLVDQYLVSRNNVLIKDTIERGDELKKIEENYMFLGIEDNNERVKSFAYRLYMLTRAQAFPIERAQEPECRKQFNQSIKLLQQNKLLKLIHKEIVSLHFFTDQNYIQLVFSTSAVKDYFLSRFTENITKFQITPVPGKNKKENDANIVRLVAFKKGNHLEIPFFDKETLNIFYRIFWRTLRIIGEKSIKEKNKMSSSSSLIIKSPACSPVDEVYTTKLSMAYCKKSFNRLELLHSVFFHRDSFMKTIFPIPLMEIIFEYNQHNCDETDEDCESGLSL